MPVAMFSIGEVRRLAKENRAIVGIGAAKASTIIRKSMADAEKKGYARKVEAYSDAGALVSALKDGAVDCAVRGSLGANDVLFEIKRQFGLRRVARAAVLDMPGKSSLTMLAPVGIDEGKSVEDRLEIAVLSSELIELFGSEPRLGILAGGRLEDTGRGAKVRKGLECGKDLLLRIRAQGISASFFGIEIESAAGTVNCIIAPDGVVGNFIFRSLHYLGGWDALGAPVLNLKSKAFIDTSRAKKEYVGAIALAGAMAELNPRR